MSGSVLAVGARYRPLPLTPAGIGTVSRAAARAYRLPYVGARLVKFTNNAVVMLPAAGAVLRIAGSAETRRRVPTVVAAARWLEALGLPAVRLYPGVPQPLPVAGHLVTVWRMEDAGGTAPDGADLARLLAALHAVDAPSPEAGEASCAAHGGGALRQVPGLPRWDLVAFIRRRLGEADGAGASDLAFLTEELEAVEELVAGLADVDPLVPPGVVHGDAFLGNVIASPSGPVLCDFDGMSVGPREWDLVPVAVGAVRFDYGAGLHEAFSTAYGVDVTAWPGFPALRRLRELQLVTSVLPVLGANPGLRPQWRLRLESLRRRDDAVRWSPYPAAAGRN